MTFCLRVDFHCNDTNSDDAINNYFPEEASVPARRRRWIGTTIAGFHGQEDPVLRLQIVDAVYILIC